ncbi:MAG: Lrp/AsnC family transcriptional regulator [Candidatus Methanomethylicia archaeon]|nr:Lrp/AsnC family transcriptional regulator [Candidatus Methanomethylicia archaeon]MCX8169326.1 Lrp/AsnC family transcriptional regulator [Candidatus Methanomethylicia archaeon]MDW7988891.1 Lrp/AsnC family transcriptional regulator [Nitrososphaerota archaeon]
MREREDEDVLTGKQVLVLSKLYESSKEVSVKSIEKSQSQLAKELGITRQALSLHLRKLKEKGFIRTGRGFIDLTEKALKILEGHLYETFVIIKVQPQKRNQVYEQIKSLTSLTKAYRVTGEIDVIAIVNQQFLNEFLNRISQMDGVISTSTHIVVEKIK